MRRKKMTLTEKDHFFYVKSLELIELFLVFEKRDFVPNPYFYE